MPAARRARRRGGGESGAIFRSFLRNKQKEKPSQAKGRQSGTVVLHGTVLQSGSTVLQSGTELESGVAAVRREGKHAMASLPAMQPKMGIKTCRGGSNAASTLESIGLTTCSSSDEEEENTGRVDDRGTAAAATPSFAVDDEVEVDRRYAKDGGVGRIRTIDETGETFTVEYTLGGMEKNIPRKALSRRVWWHTGRTRRTASRSPPPSRALPDKRITEPVTPRTKRNKRPRSDCAAGQTQSKPSDKLPKGDGVEPEPERSSKQQQKKRKWEDRNDQLAAKRTAGAVTARVDADQEEWLTTGSDWLGKHVSRTFSGVHYVGCVTRWVPSNDVGDPPLWKIKHEDGDEEDLEEYVASCNDLTLYQYLRHHLLTENTLRAAQCLCCGVLLPN